MERFFFRCANILLQMFSAKSFKYFLLILLIFSASCRYWQTPANSNSAADRTNIAEIESEIPFSTKEPETFQAEIINQFEDETETNFIARSNGRFFQRKGDLAILQKEPNQSFLINFKEKTYAENLTKSAVKESSGETLNDFLTTEWLNQKSEVRFESLGTENGLSKYRASFENSESLIFVDENFKIPVRQEFYSIEGETKTLLYSYQLQNIKLTADEQFFQIPKDFRKVSPEEFRINNH
jgi:hypothetical protein